MQLVHDGAVLIGHRGDIESTCSRINHRRSRDADLRAESSPSAGLAGCDRGDPVGRVDEALFPERAESFAVCVECIDAVVLGSYIEHVTGDTADGEIRNVKRLGENVSIDRKTESLAECRSPDVRWCKYALLLVHPGAGIVVLVGEDAGEVAAASTAATTTRATYRDVLGGLEVCAVVSLNREPVCPGGHDQVGVDLSSGDLGSFNVVQVNLRVRNRTTRGGTRDYMNRRADRRVG